MPACCALIECHGWQLVQAVGTVSSMSNWADMGAVVLQLVFQQNQHITKLDYEESGPTVVHKKCC